MCGPKGENPVFALKILALTFLGVTMRMNLHQHIADLMPHTAYQVAHLLLDLYSRTSPEKKVPEWRSVRWKDMYFPNPLGPAGGMDKSARHLKAWWTLGAGFMEVGTITPLPQKKNPGPTLKRSFKQKTLWNHLGFPGEGMEVVQKRLKALKGDRPTPLFANIGKNRHTPNDRAEEDYQKCIAMLFPYVDAFVINISSPNTKHLSQLAEPKHLKKLLTAVKEALQDHKKPFLIKWAPDMNEKDFGQALDMALESGAEGHIMGNSLTQHPPSSFWPSYGGLSGAPLRTLARQKLTFLQKHLGAERKNQLLVSVGGVLTVEEVFERLEWGADLVQVYSALVFEGPSFLKRAAKLFHHNKATKTF